MARLVAMVLLLAWIAVTIGCDSADDHQPATQPAAPPPLMLTPTETNRTIADLLGLPHDGAAWPAAPAAAAKLSAPLYAETVFTGRVALPPWPWAFPDEAGAGGFDGIAEGQSPSAFQVEQVHKAALHFAPYVLTSPTFFVCANWVELPTQERIACAQQSLLRFAQRAWRRPMAPAEVARLQAAWQANVAAMPLDEAVAMTAAGVLQAPAFLYRIEDPNGAAANLQSLPLQPWALASRLSYFLWDSMPDDALFAAAASGELNTTAGVEAQTRRMLASPKAREAVTHFHHLWLQTTNVLKIQPARSAFGALFGLAPTPKVDANNDGEWPQRMGPLRAALYHEADLFYASTIFDGDGTLTALLTSTKGYATSQSAPIYGASMTALPEGSVVTRNISYVGASLGNELQLKLYPVTFDPTQRAGVLTLPAVLAIGAYAVQPGPILRGRRVLERLACMDMGTPVAAAVASLPPDTLAVESTNRERTEQATGQAPCSGCHVRLNPPGFAFEHYDAVGRFRTLDNNKPVDASGNVTLEDGTLLTFQDGVSLAKALAASTRVRDCYVTRWARTAVGSDLAFGEAALDDLKQGFRADDSVQELLVAIATSALFRSHRQGGQP